MTISNKDYDNFVTKYSITSLEINRSTNGLSKFGFTNASSECVCKINLPLTSLDSIIEAVNIADEFIAEESIRNNNPLLKQAYDEYKILLKLIGQ